MLIKQSTTSPIWAGKFKLLELSWIYIDLIMDLIKFVSNPRAKNLGTQESTSRSKYSAKNVPYSVRNFKKLKTTSAWFVTSQVVQYEN